MSYIGNASDVEQDKNLSEFHRNRINAHKLVTVNKMSAQKAQESRWKRDDDTDSEISDSETFLAKGAFLLTPSYELSMERAALICEKLNFKGCFSLTKTATGILFKFSHPEDYQQVFKKGFHKVTGARFYKKVAVPCRPQKTFTLYVLDVPDELPVEDIRHALYKFNSVVEVVRLVVQNLPTRVITGGNNISSGGGGGGGSGGNAGGDKNDDGTSTPKQDSTKSESTIKNQETPPPLIRVTLASLDEFNILLQNGLNFYDATFFPTDANLPITSGKIVYKRSYVAGHLVSTFHNIDAEDESKNILMRRNPKIRYLPLPALYN